MKKSISVLLIVCLLLTCTVSVFAACSNTQDSIVVLYTNDVHCQLQPVRDVEEGEEPQMGYTNVAAYKKAMLADTQYVTLVDCGDYVQGDIVGAISKGEYVIDIMNKVGYDFTVLGNHEFDYGMEQLGSLLNKADATTLGCNITYTGNGTNQLSAVKPYEIVTYGKTDVAYIGVSTPHSITSSTPQIFSGRKR